MTKILHHSAGKMGSGKNKANTHISRGKYKKKFPRRNKWQQQQENVTASTSKTSLKGSRIINMEQLASFVSDISSHLQSCQLGDISLVGETYRNGMASVLTAHCSGCQTNIEFSTSHKVSGIGNGKRWESNVAAVWGQMATGGGHTRLKEVMSLMGVPVMTKKAFIATESAVDKSWWQSLRESMTEAAEEEKRLAVERGSYHEGVPAITVIVDAGWSKRSHKHSYNAKSGVGIIVGMETKKLLYVGVRNKYCSVCARAEAQKVEPSQHECHKNWIGASSSMETDIIVQGFKEAESQYGLRYTKFVGDGDSSVYPSLITEVPHWGHAIKKIECANHAIKCYRAALEKLVQDNPHYKGKGKLTDTMRKRLTKAARCAIKMRSQITDRKRAVELLRADLHNGPLHCFGVHSECSTDYCKVAQATTLSMDISTTEANTSTPSSLPAASIASVEAQQWDDAMDEDNMEEIRSHRTPTPADLDPRMILDIQRLVGRLVSKADQLLGEGA